MSEREKEALNRKPERMTRYRTVRRLVAREPPYNLTCRGFITHKLESGIDSIYGERRLA